MPRERTRQRRALEQDSASEAKQRRRDERTMKIVSRKQQDRAAQAESGHSGQKSQGGMKENPVLTLLDSIQPEIKSSRFLQSWDPQSKQIAFGYGDGTRGVVIRGDGLIESADVVVRSRFSKNVMYNAHAPGRATFDRVCALLDAFLHFDDPRVSALIALWTMGTYLYSSFSHYGYLFLYSRFPRSGKTRAQEIISHLAFDATPPLNAPTVPTIRDYASDGKTVQLDTLERLREKNSEAFHAIMEYLDAGFRNGGIVTKKERIAETWQTVVYQAYAPYTIAAIDRDSLSDTALDRSFAIEMRRKSVRVAKRRYNSFQVEKECAPIREALYGWSLGAAGSVAAVYESAEHESFVRRVQLHDRAHDIWKPIFAIAHVLGVDTTGLTGLAQELSGDPEAAADRLNLTILETLLANVENGELVATTSEIKALPGLSALNVHEVLTGWGFEQKKRWIDDESRRVWVLRERRLLALVRELRESQLEYPLEKSDQTDHENPSDVAGTLGYPRSGVSLRSKDAQDGTTDVIHFG